MVWRKPDSNAYLVWHIETLNETSLFLCKRKGLKAKTLTIHGFRNKLINKQACITKHGRLNTYIRG